MGAAAAPAALSTFGAPAATATVYSSMAASAALPTVASMAAGPLAGAGSSMFMNSAFLSPATTLRMAGGGGGLLSSFTLAKAAPYVYGLSTGTSILNTLRQGEFRKSMYEMQDLQLQANMEMKKLNAINESIDKMKEINRINAANMTAAYAGGVSGLDGSIKLLEKISGKEYGRDYQIAELDFANDLVAGNVQSDIYKQTQEQVVNGSILDAASKLGTATYMYGRLGGNPFG